MGKIVVLAEKPSVGRDIAKVLGCNTRGTGFLEGPDYIVTWAVGHLAQLSEPEDYSPELKKWNFSTLPIIPEKMSLKAVKNTKDQFDIISRLINDSNTDSLICATDSGREGELIFRYIYELSQCEKPFERLWISSMTDEAILKGFKTLKPGKDYDLLFESAKCRSEADWLVGINASRAYSIKYDSNISIGRVQTPTLAIIVARQNEIEAFVVQDYYEVSSLYDDFSGIWFSLGETRETKISSKEEAERIADAVKGKTAIVTDIEKDEKQNPPPLLYDLTELQRDANKKFGFSAEKTLSLAQDLYEKRKLITYPRTDSRYLSEDMIPQLKSVLTMIMIPPYDKFIKPLLAKELQITKRIVDASKVTDHHAIIPVNFRPKLEGLSQDEKNVYDLIVRRFISVFYPYYIFTITRIIMTCGDHHFLSRGKTINQTGWMELYPQEEDKKGKKKSGADEEQLLPDVKIADIRCINDAKVLHKKTKPPSPYTEAALLSAMENAGRFVEDEDLKEKLKESGLGTPATRAGIIERLISVGYIERKGKSLVPTEKGRKLIEVVPLELKSPETTGKWEKGLTSIYKGALESVRFMGSIIRYVKYIISECNKTKHSVKFPRNPSLKSYKTSLPEFGQCPKCKEGVILENSKSYYCSEWKRDCKFSIWKNSLEKDGVEISGELISALLKDGKYPVNGVSVVLNKDTGMLMVIKG